MPRLLIVTLSVAFLSVPAPGLAKQIAGIEIGMSADEAKNVLNRLGELKRTSAPDTKATDISVGKLVVTICEGKVVAVQRKLPLDFHGFGRVYNSEVSVAGKPTSESFYSSDEDGRSATSLGFIWQTKTGPIYSIHFSQFGGAYETIEILDYPPDRYDEFAKACGM